MLFFQTEIGRSESPGSIRLSQLEIVTNAAATTGTHLRNGSARIQELGAGRGMARAVDSATTKNPLIRRPLDEV